MQRFLLIQGGLYDVYDVRHGKYFKKQYPPRIARVLEIQERYNDLVKRGIIKEEPPKTFGEAISATPNNLMQNKHINYSLS